MRKILLIIATLFTGMCASASNVEKIQFANAGKFSLGVMAGFPFFEEGINDGMPYVSLDAMIGLKDGFCHTEKFGDNGAIDLGVYIGYARNKYNFRELVYNEESQTTEDLGEYTWSSWAIPATVRGAFHWEFVKNLDVYAGLQLGCSTYGTKRTPLAGGKGRETMQIDLIACHYLGAKWMFTKFFGVKAECSMLTLPVSDVCPKLPLASVGFQFNF